MSHRLRKRPRSVGRGSRQANSTSSPPSDSTVTRASGGTPSEDRNACCLAAWWGVVSASVGVAHHRTHELGGDHRDAAHALALGHGADVAGVDFQLDPRAAWRRLPLATPGSQDNGLDGRLHFGVEPLAGAPEADLDAGDRQVPACWKGVAQEGLRQAVGHDGCVAALQPQPLRVRPLGKRLGQGLKLACADDEAPQRLHREYSRGLSRRALPKAVR